MSKVKRLMSVRERERARSVPWFENGGARSNPYCPAKDLEEEERNEEESIN